MQRMKRRKMLFDPSWSKLPTSKKFYLLVQRIVATLAQLNLLMTSYDSQLLNLYTCM